MRIRVLREAIQEPHWWHSGFHAVPGGNVIVQEEDWGSIIAFTLSSFDYQRELANPMNPRPLRAPIAHPHSPSPPARPLHPPDREDSAWDKPEAYSAVVTRKEYPRDPMALLSLREVFAT
ncbi:hypothetical protein F5888DRAFT_1803202 [Russula emetica]|nr:hypothetical protein F5888DRAFT_1803202 [Russula emetica]